MNLRTTIFALSLGLPLAAGSAVAQVFSTPLLQPNAGRPGNGGMPTGEVDGVGVDQKLDSVVDLEAQFIDHEDEPVVARELFDGRRPVILTFNFSDCPTQCSAQLELLAVSLAEIEELSPGKDFRVVTVSLDHTENSVKAAAARERYLADIGREGADWTFLRGNESNIKRLADSVGYRFKWTGDANKIQHYAALILLTPEGRIARYMGGMSYVSSVLRLSIIEASDGKIGGIYEDLFLLCFAYDAHTGKYTLFATNFLLFGAAITVVVLGWFLWRMFRLEAARRREAASAEVLNG
jgi:protein SCO1